MRLLIAPDKFKGSLSALDVATAIEDGWWAGSGALLEVRRIPMADGGEGTSAVIRASVGGVVVECAAHDALGRPLTATYVLATDPDGRRLAVIDMSEASGLQRIDPEERRPLRSSTRGTGELLRHAVVDSGADVVIVGLGGSATNDGGAGLATALGYGFVDDDGGALGPGPAELVRLARITAPLSLPSAQIIGGVDVRSTLLGPTGATAVFGPQKGLVTSADQELAEAGLRRLADVVAATFGVDHAKTPGAGAAGGLGFGLLAFCGAELRPGFDVVAEAVHLEEAIQWCDVVVTGEGCLDAQTLQGKAPLGVAALARKLGKPVIVFAGQIDPSARPALQPWFHELIELRSVDASVSVSTSMTRAAELLREGARRAAARWAAQPER